MFLDAARDCAVRTIFLIYSTWLVFHFTQKGQKKREGEGKTTYLASIKRLRRQHIHITIRQNLIPPRTLLPSTTPTTGARARTALIRGLDFLEFPPLLFFCLIRGADSSQSVRSLLCAHHDDEVLPDLFFCGEGEVVVAQGDVDAGLEGFVEGLDAVGG